MTPNNPNDNSEAIRSGVLFNRILRLEPRISEAILALDQKGREEIMALEGDGKKFEAAVAKLLEPKQPMPPPAAATAGTKEGTK